MKKIPGLLRAVQYERTGARPGPYEHVAEGPTEIIGLKEGSVKLRSTDGRPLWGTDASGEAWLENRPKRKERRMARHHHRHRHHHRNPYLAAFNPSIYGTLTHYFSMRGLTGAAQAGGSGIAGAGTTFLSERVLFSYLNFLTPYASGTDWTSILVRGASRLGLVGLVGWLLGGFFKGHNKAAFVAGSLTYAVGATGLEAAGYQMQIGAGLPLSSVLQRVGLVTVAGAGAFVHQPGTRVPAIRGTGAFVQRPTTVARIGNDITVAQVGGAGDMYMTRMHPFWGPGAEDYPRR